MISANNVSEYVRYHLSFLQSGKLLKGQNPLPPPSPPCQGGEKGEVRTSLNDGLKPINFEKCL
jgi:hypothetical protein